MKVEELQEIIDYEPCKRDLYKQLSFESSKLIKQFQFEYTEPTTDESKLEIVDNTMQKTQSEVDELFIKVKNLTERVKLLGR